jgi:hypothetical protein
LCVRGHAGPSRVIPYVGGAKLGLVDIAAAAISTNQARGSSSFPPLTRHP